MTTVTSADGTTIGYEHVGSGPALILVDGAFCSRQFGPMPALAKLLAEHFTVYMYDRRGRGASGDTLPYAPEREIEDLDALIDAAGGTAYVHGTSSGAVLALRATAALPGKVTRLASYEAPMLVDASRTPPPADYRQQVDRMVASGRNGDVVAFFMTKVVGAPGFVPYVLRLMPAWKKLKDVAPTLRYDFAILGDSQLGKPIPDDLAKAIGAIDVPVWVGDGGKSPRWMHHAQDEVAALLADSRRDTLAGQNHQVKAAVIAPALTAFFAEDEVR
ncbi:MAG TPA: alpha/beta fold hydrolase [Micromonosporaceae bacterium]|jgi:pimeloyl-ACP methyl ester carboxylesterase|nr:alpha/beta fold hydrolase [Micromonosporaceae bacterium]